MSKRLIAVAFAALLSSAISGASGSKEIFVDRAAAPGGDGKTPTRAYNAIREAVNDVNGRDDSHDYVIRIAEGTYVEPPGTITIRRDGVRLLGSTRLTIDESGFPTETYEHATTVRPDLPPGTLIPSGSALIRVIASRVELAGLVLDGGVPRPPPGPPGEGLLVVVDGIATGRQLDGIVIRNNVVINTSQATQLRLASAALIGNFFARSVIGVGAFGGFENVAHPEQELALVISGNRFVEHRNIALNVIASVGVVPSPSTTPGLVPGPSVSHSLIERNDFQRNSNGPAYPQPIQYSALNFNPMHESSDTLQPSRMYTLIQGNRFVENGYGLSVSQRVRTNQNEASYSFEGRLAGNFYCGNGLNDAFFNFNLNSQSHGIAAAGVFRHATNSTYTIDATDDGLAPTRFDYDHPLLDPRMPLNAPGTLVLTNLLTFNGAIVPTGVQITRPPVLSPGPPAVFGPIDVGLTPALSLIGPDHLFVNRNSSFVDPGVLALDPCEGRLNDRVITTGSVDVTTPGTYVITYDVSNAVGKSAPAVERSVTVRGKHAK